MSRLSAPESWDRRRRTVGLFLGPLIFFAVLAMPSNLDPPAQRMAAIFGLVIVLWVSEAIPLAATALLGPALAVPLGVAGHREAFASFGHPIIFLFIGSFLIAGAMRTHGLDRRIALFVLSRRWVGEHPGRILLAFGAIAAFLSMWMSNTTTAAMMLPVALGVLSTLPTVNQAPRTRSYATGLMLMIAFSCNVGGIATPVGTPPNLIAIGMLEEIRGSDITFLDWMSFGVPIAAVLFGFVYVVALRLFPASRQAFRGSSSAIHRQRETIGPMNNGERAALTAFLVAVTLWTLPGVVGLMLGKDHAASQAISRALPEGPSAILAAVLLFVLPVDWKARRFALDWREAVKIDWGTILLFGGGLSLGTLAFSSGLAQRIGAAVIDFAGDMPIWALALLALFLANLMTEFMSNTATASLLIPMFLALAGQASGHPSLPALAATLGCSLAFCLPVATPPNAIVYGSGHVPLITMIRVGVLLDLGCGLLAWAMLMMLVG